MMAASVSLFCNKDSKSLKSPTRITLRALLCTQLIILFDVLEQNIQTRGQKLNWDFTTALKRSVFSESLSWLDSLDKADIFWEAFSHNSLMWVLNVSLFSIITPSIFSSLLLFIIVSLKLKVSFVCIFAKAHKMTFPCI